MKITVIAVGKVREKFFLDGMDEYLKRLSAYARCEIIEVADEKTREGASERENELVKNAEGRRILDRIPERAYVIALAIQGRERSSEEMAGRLEALMNGGSSSLVFLIGGSLGLSQEVLSRADEQWSFSRLTFPHQMMRMILLEQLYRSFRIIHHEPYHK